MLSTVETASTRTRSFNHTASSASGVPSLESLGLFIAKRCEKTNTTSWVPSGISTCASVQLFVHSVCARTGESSRRTSKCE